MNISPGPFKSDPFKSDPCARERIRTPGTIQPHGALIVLAPETNQILQASENTRTWFNLPGDGPLKALNEVAGTDSRLAAELDAWVAGDEPVFLRRMDVGGRDCQVSAHRTKQGIVVEFEDPPETEAYTLDALYPRLRQFMTEVAGTDVDTICRIAARDIRAIIGFNRVLVYSFDEKWNGKVVAEDGDGVLPSYLGLHFPEADIPAQARELYRLNRLRAIPDADYTPVAVLPAVNPTDGMTLDMSFAALRSVSPVHLEFMRNMGTLSSLSVSILVDGKLWGLISCHHATPKRVGAQVRAACDFVTQIVSLQIGAREQSRHAAKRLELKQIETDLLARLARAENFQIGLGGNPEPWLKMTGAHGAALFVDGSVVVAGRTPSEARIRDIADWLWHERPGESFATKSLAAKWPAGLDIVDVASGLLAVSISQIKPGYIMWFRCEAIKTVTWSGDPRKPEADDDGRIGPRRSFEAWKEMVRHTAMAWSPAEIETARDFRRAIINFMLKRAEERAELTGELQRTNKELESFSYSVSHDLRAPFRHIAGYAELLGAREKSLDAKSRHYLASIVEAAVSAGELVDDLLNFSQLGRASILKRRVDIGKLIQEIRRHLEPDLAGRTVEWRIGDLPPTWGDAGLLRQALANIIGNAVKYTRKTDLAVIAIEGQQTANETVYTIRDNGVGFDMAYVGKIFGVFQRLHRSEDFEGTGIGLASAKRIIDRHGGWISASGAPDLGATFTFSLPNRDMEKAHG